MFYVYRNAEPYPVYSSNCMDEAIDWGLLNADREAWRYWEVVSNNACQVYENNNGEETYTNS